MRPEKEQADDLYKRLVEKYGHVMTVAEVAELFKYPSESAARQAHTAGNLPVTLKKWPGRRALFATTREAADAIEALSVAEDDRQR